MSDSRPSRSKKRFLLVFGLLIGGIVGYSVIAHWSDIKAGFHDGYRAAGGNR